MRIDEAATLVAEARALYPGMSIVPGIADAWNGVLGDLSLPECREALMKHGRGESRIPVPADVRRIALAVRQDAAMRALPSGSDALVPMPEWFHTTVAQHKARTREENRLRKERGERPYYGETVIRPSDQRPR